MMFNLPIGIDSIVFIIENAVRWRFPASGNSSRCC
nr:MAG TPA: hypothetical protein [Caudoviricetes sp.]